MCLGVIWGMVYSNFYFSHKFPPVTIYLAVAALICGFIVTVVSACVAAYRPYDPNAVNEEHQVEC